MKTILIALSVLCLSVVLAFTTKNSPTPFAGSPNNAPEPPPANISITEPEPSDSLGVIELLNNKSGYEGKSVSVTGIIQIIVNSSDEACRPEGTTECSSPTTVELKLTDSANSSTGNSIDLYKDGKPYPCAKIQNTYSCQNYQNNTKVTVTGKLIKTQVPDLVMGSSNGPPKTLTWKDFYYLEIN